MVYKVGPPSVESWLTVASQEASYIYYKSRNSPGYKLGNFIEILSKCSTPSSWLGKAPATKQRHMARIFKGLGLLGEA